MPRGNCRLPVGPSARPAGSNYRAVRGYGGVSVLNRCTKEICINFESPLTLYAEERATSELQARDRACAQLIAEQRRAEARPVRWALRRLYIHYASTVLAGLVLTALVGMAWIKMA